MFQHQVTNPTQTVKTTKASEIMAKLISRIQALITSRWQKLRPQNHKQKKQPSTNNKRANLQKIPRQQYDFLPVYLDVIEKPPAPWARRTALTITLLIFITIAWSIIGKLDIHASSSGRVMISSYSKQIQSIEQGEVLRINVKDGQYVRKGDSLIDLNPLGAEVNHQALAQQHVLLAMQQARYLALLSNDLTKNPFKHYVAPSTANAQQQALSLNFLQSEYQQNINILAQLTSEIAVNIAQQQSKTQEIQLLQRLRENVLQRLQARQALVKSQAISKVELLEQEREILELDKELATLASDKIILQSQVKSLQQQKYTFIAQKRREYNQSLEEVNGDITQVEQQLIQATDMVRVQSLTSPVDGVVQQLAIHTIGGVVTPAQILMIIVPTEKSLEVEVMVLNKDVGFVQVGQEVAIKIDSFPFTKYGTITGEVLHVSGDAVQHEQLGLVFPTRVSLESDEILVDEQMIKINAGMSIVAEIKTGTRRVIEYLLTPLLRYQSEALRER